MTYCTVWHEKDRLALFVQWFQLGPLLWVCQGYHKNATDVLYPLQLLALNFCQIIFDWMITHLRTLYQTCCAKLVRQSTASIVLLFF